MTELIVAKESKKWVPLHVHSEYSALDGAIRVPEYYKFTQRHGIDAAGVSDHYNMSAFVEMDKTFSDVKPIFGCELYAASFIPTQIRKRKFHLSSWALNKKGFINLQKLAARGYAADDESNAGPYAVPFSALEEFHEGIAFSSACLGGELPQLLANGLETSAREWLDKVLSVVGRENFYIELMDIGDYKPQLEMNDKLFALANSCGVKTIITTDSHYFKEDESWYGALVAAQKRQTLSEQEFNADSQEGEDEKVWDMNRMDLSLRTPEQMWERWKDKYPEALEETVRLSEKTERFSIRGDRYLLPHLSAGGSGFKDEARRGLEKRLAFLSVPSSEKEAYFSRLDYECDVIEGMGFVDYFLMVGDLVSYAKQSGIKVGPGRGSAAGSVLAWSMEITELDPLKFGLIFERFLNPQRISMPDIDIDFEDERRPEIIKYLKSKYGDGAVMPIANYTRSKWKTAIRDASRVVGSAPWQTEVLVKTLEGVVDSSLANISDDGDWDADENIDAKSLTRYLFKQDSTRQIAGMNKEVVSHILDLAGHFKGLLRNYGKHASGMVISPSRIDDFVPVGRVGSKSGGRQRGGTLCAQYDMDGIDYCKLVKIDVLGLSTLSMIKEMETVAKTFDHNGIKSPEMHDFVKFMNKHGTSDCESFADPELEAKGITADSIRKTFDSLARGETTGVFQLGGGGMRKLITDVAPRTVEDLSSCVALYRPGPLNSGIAASYIAAGDGRRWKRQTAETVKFPDSVRAKIEKLCAETRGLPIYQEHIMKIAQELAGYSLGEADNLRKAIGKKKLSVMETERGKFTEHCAAGGISPQDAEETFHTIEYFAGYGFNKSHSACYALLAFLTAWYRANRTPVFWAAVINDTIKKARQNLRGEYVISPLLREIGKSYPVLPPMLSDTDESVEDMRNTMAVESVAVKGEDFRFLRDNEHYWETESNWVIKLGISAAKRVGKNEEALRDILDMGIKRTDTLSVLMRKAISSEKIRGIAATGTLFLNGFFDSILSATLKSKQAYIHPVYLRLAILLLSDAANINSPAVCALNETASVLNGKSPNPHGGYNGYVFAIAKSRSVWGSYLKECCERIIKKTKYKRETSRWNDMRVQYWIDNEFELKVVGALVDSACKIEQRMREDQSFKAECLSAIYQIEKEDYGEGLTVPDWGLAGEITDWGFDLFADEAVAWRDLRWKNRSADFTSQTFERLSRSEEGILIAGQFEKAVWKGDGGYILLQGRYGSGGRSLFVQLEKWVPFLGIEAIKKVHERGGFVVLRVKYDSDKNSFTLLDDGKKADPSVNAGQTDCPSSIYVLPLLGNFMDTGLIKLKSGDKR